MGNVVGVKPSHAELRTAKGKELLRHELVHNWQYRRGGLLNLGRLGLEQAGAFGNDPYDRAGTLEYAASTGAYDSVRVRKKDGYSGFGKPRPWELSCIVCDRFY